MGGTIDLCAEPAPHFPLSAHHPAVVGHARTQRCSAAYLAAHHPPPAGHSAVPVLQGG